MRLLFRWLRRALSVVFTIGIVAGAGYFAFTAISGIADEIEFRREEIRRDGIRNETATFIAPTLFAESQRMRQGPHTERDVAAESSTETPTSQPDDTDSTATEVTASTATTTVTVDNPQPTETADAVREASSLNDASNTAITTSTATQTATITDAPTATSTLVTATATTQPTDTTTPTSSATSTDTSTPLPSSTPTVAPTEVAQDPPTAIPTNTLPPTALPTNTPFPTVTLTPTDTATPTNTPTATNTPTPTNTSTPTPTLTPSNTPTATNTPLPTLPIEGTYATPVGRPIIDIPLQADLAEDSDDILHIVLLGSDVESSLARTDVIIVVSVNRETGTAAMWHIPRDLLVYIPGYTVDKINLTFQVGQQTWPTGGPGLLREMFRYNFGIEVDYYARVDFDDFQAIIDRLGNLQVSVDCEITDWRLIDPENSPPAAFEGGEEEDAPWRDYWEQYTLTVGVHELSPYMSLWYARSRVTTNDLDRGRRQMDLLRAMWRQARGNGIFNDLSLFPEALQIVDTDMPLEVAVSLAPVALALDLGDIERFSMIQNVHMVPRNDEVYGFVYVPQWDVIRALVQDFVTPPSGNRLQLESASVEVLDGTLYGLGWGQVAVDRLAWEGFTPILGQRTDRANGVTTIYDYTGTDKGNELSRLQEILRVGDQNIVLEPDPDRTFDYRVVVGRSYQSCVYGSSADDVIVPDTPFDATEDQ
jgi:polyisoprenyl-teichoic acid--peptidoglycan teichoic acid transferase